MMLREIPQAAGITGILTAAGLSSSEVHEWFHTRRDELVGLTPSLALMTIVAPPNVGRTVLALAQADALELRKRAEHEPAVVRSACGLGGHRLMSGSSQRNGSGAYAPCECGGWPNPGDARVGRCRLCWNYSPAEWYLRKQRRERRARGWRAVALAALYPLRVLAQLTHRDAPEEGRS